MEASGQGAAGNGAGPAGVAEGGQEAPSQGLYDLESVPGELRPFMEEQLKKIDGNLTRRFQEHAEFRKQWEPYQDTGIESLAPEDVQSLVAFAQLAQDPEQFKAWLAQAADQIGWEPEVDQDRWSQLGAEQGWLDEITGQQQPAEDMQQQLQALLDQRLGPLEEQAQQQQQQQAEVQATEEITGILEQLHTEHGEFDDNRVAQMAYVYDQLPIGEALQRGLQDYLEMTGQAQSSLIDSKLEQPAPAMTGGQPDTAPQDFSFGDPGLKEAAKARLAAR